jgi:hypothetical protein
MSTAQDLQTPPSPATIYGKALAGALVGGAIGWWLFFVLVGQGFYSLALPGALLGYGCGKLSGRRSKRLGIFCAVAALFLGIVLEWRFAPFVKDGSFVFFITHLGDLRGVSKIMIGLGALFGYWFGIGRDAYYIAPPSDTSPASSA